MLKITLIVFALLSHITLCAQQLTNMKVTQEVDKVIITYDINTDKVGQTFDIKVECSSDNGKTFLILPQNLSGDLNEVKAGSAKRIVWDVLNERQELIGDEFVFQLIISDINSGTFTDTRDLHVYKWTKIGRQVWMAENLAFKTNNYSWAYNNDESYVIYYGRLYDWETARNVCPIGWHLPSETEWTTLITFLGGESVAGNLLKKISTSQGNTSKDGRENNISFNALLGGYRFDGSSKFYNVGTIGYWWTSSTIDLNQAWYRYLNYSNTDVNRYFSFKKRGFSVRCIRD